MVASATFFWWWVSALWQFVTKRGSTYVGEILLLGGDCWCFGVVVPFRLYLGASFYIYIFGSWCIFVFVWVVHDKGRKYVVSICFFFHIVYWFIFMWLFMIYVFIFMLCEMKKLLCFTCIFHTCVYAFVDCFRNIQVDSIVLLSTLATNR